MNKYFSEINLLAVGAGACIPQEVAAGVGRESCCCGQQSRSDLCPWHVCVVTAAQQIAQANSAEDFAALLKSGAAYVPVTRN